MCRNSVSASNFALHWGEIVWELFKHYTSWKVGSWKNTSFCMVFHGQKQCDVC
jgi:hypothetical protein